MEAIPVRVLLIMALLIGASCTAVAEPIAGPVWVVFDTDLPAAETLTLTFSVEQRAVLHNFVRKSGQWLGRSATSWNEAPTAAAVSSGEETVVADPAVAPAVATLLIPASAGQTRRLLIFEGGASDITLLRDGGAAIPASAMGEARVYRATDFGVVSARAEILGTRAHAMLPGVREETLSAHTFGFFASALAGESGMTTIVRGPSGTIECPCTFHGEATAFPYEAGQHTFEVMGAGVSIAPEAVLVLADVGPIE